VKEGKLNKTELAQKLAKQIGLTQILAQDVVDAIFSTAANGGIIAMELASGNKVTISGFGTFAIKSRAARKGRNPATGREIEIPARKYAHFAPAKNLKDRLSA
jgi:DNA-binding protein HU-beta